MLNAADTTRVVDAIAALVARHPPRTPVIAFDSALLVSRLRNARAVRALEDVNDVLCGTAVCQKLGGIYTVCEYERSIWFIICAESALTDDVTQFDPKSKASL